MKQLFTLLFIAFFFSCNNNSNEPKQETTDIPATPAGIEAVAKTVIGKNFTAYKIATLSPFEMDKENPYDWLDDKKDTTAFTRNYVAERMKMKLNFINDSTVQLTDEDKITEGTYKLDTLSSEDEKPGIKLRISYSDTSMNFPGVTEPMIMTSTYTVLGINNESLLLEMPRSFNNRKIAVLMKLIK